MGSALVIHDVGADTALVCIFVIAEGILIAGITRAENNNLGIAVDDLREDGVHKIQALLVSQAGDQADNEFSFIYLKAEAFLKSTLVLSLLCQNIGKVIVCSQQGIRFAVPDIAVDTVDNAAQFVGMMAQMGIQTFTEERGLNLAGIRSAHRGDHIGECKPAFEHIGINIVLLQNIDVEEPVVQAGPVFDCRNVVNALEAQVVNGHHHFCPADRCAGELCAQIERNKTGLPVMAMDDIRNPVQIVQCGKSSFVKVAVLGNIVNKVGIRVAPAEELIVVDEVIHHAVPYIFHNADVERTAVGAEIHGEGTTINHLFLVLPGNAFITRQNYFDVTVLFRQSSRKCIHNIAEAACFHKRIAFGADKRDASARLRKLFLRSTDHFDGLRFCFSFCSRFSRCCFLNCGFCSGYFLNDSFNGSNLYNRLFNRSDFYSGHLFGSSLSSRSGFLYRFFSCGLFSCCFFRSGLCSFCFGLCGRSFFRRLCRLFYGVSHSLFLCRFGSLFYRLGSCFLHCLDSFFHRLGCRYFFYRFGCRYFFHCCSSGLVFRLRFSFFTASCRSSFLFFFFYCERGLLGFFGRLIFFRRHNHSPL